MLQKGQEKGDFKQEEKPMNKRHPQHFGLGSFSDRSEGGGGREMTNRCTSTVETHTKGLHLHTEVTPSALSPAGEEKGEEWDGVEETIEADLTGDGRET